MKKAKIITQNLLTNQQRVTLLDLLDRLLDKGVVAKGEIILSVADIDLVYLNLGLLLSSVKTVEQARRRGGRSRWVEGGNGEDFFKEESPNIRWVEEVKMEETVKPSNGESRFSSNKGNGELVKLVPRTNIDPNNVEKGLTKLVLTLVELLRRLMERQAVRRMESGSLSAGEVEILGTAFLRLDERMEDLKEAFLLKDEELNLDLGPLGELM